jgi:GT2 family glycosyltransferase
MHGKPTSVGLWDLGAPATGTLIRLLGSDPARACDQIALVRLHGQPLTILHLEGPPGEPDASSLITAVWHGAHETIISHVRSCGCLPLPSDAGELLATLSQSDGSCPGRIPRRPQGHAAVVVCTTGAQRSLTRCLESLAEMRCDDFEVIVVDNRPSTDDTRGLIEGLAVQVPVRYVAEPRPGLAVARNAGVAAAAHAAYVAFTDDDVVVDEQWLAGLLAPFEQPPVSGVTGLVMPLCLDSRTQKRFEQYAGFGKGVLSETYDLTEHRARDRFLYPYWGGLFGSGNSMAFRREALLAAGGFDPALGAGTPTGGGEDIAAFSDVILAGGQIVYEPRSICWHEHRSDDDTLRIQVRNYGIGLTAVLWRYLWKDWRFSVTVLRSLPSTVRLLRSRSQDRQTDRLPNDLARLEARGRLLGPWRYVVSRRNSSGSRAGSAGPPADPTR